MAGQSTKRFFSKPKQTDTVKRFLSFLILRCGMARPKQSLAAVQLAKQKRAKAFNVDTPGTRAECFKYLESLLLDKTFGVAAEGMRSGKRKKLNFLHQLISVSTKRSSSSCFERVTNKTNIRKMFSSLPPSEKLKFRTFYAKLKEQVPVYFFLP